MAITYTLAGLKAEIANDLARSDLTNEIANAIETSITTMKVKKFWFNQTRTETFDTVADQSAYATADDAAIPLMLEVRGMIIEDSDGQRFDLGEPIDAVDMQLKLGTGAATGRPYEYAYFNESFIFHPIPDAVYTITPMGWIKVAMPATDNEVDNVWMTHGFEEVRSAAKAYLYIHVIKDQAEAAVYVDAAQGAEAVLNRTTSLLTATGRIRPTTW